MPLEFQFVFVLVIVYGTSYSLKFLEQYDIPILAVEILAGVIFGSFFGIIGPETQGYEFLLSMAALGLLLIMFEAGLELDPALIQDNPKTVGILGSATFGIPFISGLGLGLLLNLSIFASFLIGVTVSTTSLGLVYPLLEDFGYIETERGQLILSVAVFNDIISVIALAYGITLTSPNPIFGLTVVTATVLFFFVVVPNFLVEYLETIVPDTIVTNPTKFGVFLAVGLAFLMEQVGIHAILGGFFAGLLIAEVTHEGHEVDQAMDPVVDLVAPVFFFFVGMQFQLRVINMADIWIVVTVIILGLGAKIVGSLIGGLLTNVTTKTTYFLAAVMPGRLAISVAAAEIGLSQGIISPIIYDAFLVLSTLSVFVASLSFRYLSQQEKRI
ncbi:MAG: cation:proton antiporter [Halobacteriaceae archaeon]